jgi:hypothetical protein
MGREILEHHVFNIRLSTRGVRNRHELKKIINQETTRQANLKTEDGQPMYPGLQTSDGRSAYKKEKMRMVTAVKSGQFITIPDINQTDGSPNFDGLCDLCGNRDGNNCTKPDQITLQ